MENRNFLKIKAKNEWLYRWLGIVSLGLFLSVMFDAEDIFSKKFVLTVVISIIQSAIFWHGTMLATYLVEKLAKRLNFLVFLMVNFVVVGLYVYSVCLFFRYLYINIYHGDMSQYNFTGSFLLSLFITYFISAVYVAIYYFNEYKQNMIKAEKLETANIEARFEMLKTQINPHFLFNSLNTLMNLVEENSTALRYTESLSEFMRYLLQSKEKKVVALADELHIVRGYVFMQKIRFEEKLDVSITINSDLFEMAVPPLSIQMLIENAIKHNIVSAQKPLKVEIFESCNKACVVIRNNLQPRIEHEPSAGVGLQNIVNRYSYLTNNKVVINRTEDYFSVQIPLLSTETKY